MNSPETPCAAVEERLSAFLDGELPADAAAGALEHAFACASCRAFFVAARRLQELALEAAPGVEPARGAEASPAEAAVDGPAADRLWQRIRAESGLGQAPRRSRFGATPWLRAAALVAFGLGGGYLLAGANRSLPAVTGAPAGAPAAGVVVVSAPATGGAMDERRFLLLAEELLAADRKYQRTMLQVLRLVPALETGEGLDQPEDGGFVRARVEPERSPRGSV